MAVSPLPFPSPLLLVSWGEQLCLPPAGKDSADISGDHSAWTAGPQSPAPRARSFLPLSLAALGDVLLSPISQTFCRPLSCTPESSLLTIRLRRPPSVGSRLWPPVCQQEDPLILKHTHRGSTPVTPLMLREVAQERSYNLTLGRCRREGPLPDTAPSGWPTPTHPALPQAISLVLIRACDERPGLFFRLGSELLINADSARSSPSPCTGRD